MNKRTRLCTGLVTAIGLLAACGGSGGEPVATDAADDEAAVETTSPATTPPTEPPATEPPATEPSTTEPPATEPPSTEPASDRPDWASGELATVQTDTGLLELPVELVPFCESSRSFYIAANAVDLVRDGQFGTSQQLFAALAAVIPSVIESAPSDEFAAEPTDAQDQLAVIIPAFEEVGYDNTRASEVSDPDALLEAVRGFTSTRDSLRTFLVDVCGAEGDVLDEQSQGAVEAAAAAAGETIEPAEPAEPVAAAAGTPITNEASNISLSVPVDWTETEESLEDGRQQLVASSDIDTFYGLATPGVLMLRGEGGFRDGGFVGRVLEFQADLEGIGCTVVAETDYDDGVYSGQER
ncbi:MAG: hypothetical protein ABJ314_04670, partial [Ilumatobacter sp.]